ncbi:hypothetical protein Scep_021606 [Stephania cephalantha]|uniref:Uncharacterized protein n=1 Tax=Stephania cephalantha TaxID=152367 RepID=A0AAP0F993_9MAGN
MSAPPPKSPNPTSSVSVSSFSALRSAIRSSPLFFLLRSALRSSRLSLLFDRLVSLSLSGHRPPNPQPPTSLSSPLSALNSLSLVSPSLGRSRLSVLAPATALSLSLVSLLVRALTRASPLASVNVAALADAGAFASAISPSLILRDFLQVTRLLDQRYWHSARL